MIIEIYAGLILFSLIIIILGYFVDNPILEIAGFTFLFLLGFVLNGGLIQYKTGNNITEIITYGNNFTGYHWDYDTGTAPDGPLLDAYVFHTSTIENNIYSNFDDSSGNIVQGISLSHFFGWLITIIGGLGFFVTITSIKNKRGMNE